ncbi:MAG TPA: TonB-dependent receptor [Gemmatimonadaceae bacterium]
MRTVLARRILGVSFIVAPITSVAGSVPIPRDSTRIAVAVPPIAGVVRDTSGAPLHDAQVVIAALNRVVVTNDSGRFVFTGLPAGTHHLSALLLGYRPGHADVTLPTTGSAPVQVTIVMARASTVQQLSAIQVTATPIGTDPRDVAQSTTELSERALARGIGGSVAQTLAREPGMAVRFNGPAASAPVIRGLSGERVLVLQDGERSGDLASSSPDHAVSIDPLTAQRIEVVRGPASLLYGNNALGGVVNVISNDLPTSIPTHIEGYLAGQAESATPGGGSAVGLTMPLGPSLAAVLKATGRHTEDLRMGGGGSLENSYNQNFSGVGGLAFARGAASAGLLYRGYGFKYGLPSADGEGSHIEGNRQELSGRTEIGAPVGPFSSLKLDGAAQWYTHDEVERSGALGTRFNLRTQSLDILGRTQFGRVTGAVGASGLFRQYEATGEEALTPAANSTGAGLFLYQEVPLRTAPTPDSRVPRLQLGGRYDIYDIASKTGAEKFGTGRALRYSNVSGSVGLSIPVAAGVTVAASAARAFRAPTVEELFSNAFHAAVGTFDRGNPELKVETSQGLDGIVRVERRGLTAQLSAYVNRVNDFITPSVSKDTLVEGEGGPRSVPLNHFSQADATLKGAEGRVEVEVLPRIVLGTMGDVVRGAFRSGEPLPYMPPARLGVLARYDDGHWAIDAELRHALAQVRVPVSLTTSDPAGMPTSAFDLVNLSAGYAFDLGGRRHLLTLRADNLLDEEYREATSRLKNFASNPGRNLALVYRVTF